MNGLNLLQQYIKEQELTGVILISPINLHYFAGFTGTTGFAIITQDKAFMITDFRYTCLLYTSPSCSMWNNIKLAEGGYTVIPFIAVSYTHLDVYKRQSV